MRFLKKNKVDRILLVISDIHLGAGKIVDGKRNYLEDFTYDKELVEFLEYYSLSPEYEKQEVELVINGDLFDFLAVPFVKYFDDEFWSEKALLEKFDLILNAHPEVIEALTKFVSSKKKTITYIIGNHDAEMVFKSAQNKFMNLFEDKDKLQVKILIDGKDYGPTDEIMIKHGHEYEFAHKFNPDKCIIEDTCGTKYFLPPWGSYYVTRVINKFKEERDHTNSVRPIRKFLINGLIYDTLFTIRFIFSNIFYFAMVRSIYILKMKKNFSQFFKHCLHELELFQDYETITDDYFSQNPGVKVLLVGHTHDPIIRSNSDGNTFINTGCWTRMHNLDFKNDGLGELLTYSKIEMKKDEGKVHLVSIALNAWKGQNKSPFIELS